MSNIDDFHYHGSCLCGAIRYEVKKIEPNMAHCHCAMCRKFHGSAFATFAEAKAENFRWVRGEEFLTSYVASNGTTRKFCSQCGSSMTYTAAVCQDDVIEFSLGTLDSDISIRPDAHIYVASKANWVELHDKLPKYLGGRHTKPEIA